MLVFSLLCKSYSLGRGGKISFGFTVGSTLVLSSMFRVTPGTKDTVRHLGIDVDHENSQHRNDPFSDMISL